MFKRSSAKLEALLRERLGSRVKVSINPGSERPGKGNFVVTVNGTAAISLVGMPRPFKKLRELDMEAAADSIAAGV